MRNTIVSTARRGLLAALVVTLAGSVHLRAAVVHDLTPLHDATRVLVNPHKGWYHHFPDNHINKYKIARDADLLEFPGMDHIYIRLAWSYLEPKEGKYDWAVIDRIIDKWTAHGMSIAFRISCKETGTDRIEQQFATPRWVMDAGARGGHYSMGKATGPEGPWEPEFGDPIFLAKLDQFLAAFAARYDHQPWLRYVDVGSIGDWGEGHTWAGSRKECGFSVRKQHVDLYLKHFKRAPIVVSDDYVYALGNRAERQALHQYVITNGISYRDDSILVNWYVEGASDTFSVRSPEFFADAFPNTPTVFELEHYGTVKRQGNWDAQPNSNMAKFGKGQKGPDFFRKALELLHATYIGYHGDAREWLTDNPELTKELINRCGYWLFPKAIELPDTLLTGATLPITLTMENRGVAPPYAPYELRIKLSGSDGPPLIQTLAKGVKAWMPGTPVSSHYKLTLPDGMKPGVYALSIGLFDVRPNKDLPVDFALKAALRDAEGYYQVASVNVERGAQKALDAYRAELRAFRQEFGGERDLPDVRFFLFGMGQRSKWIYRDGKLINALTQKALYEWTIGKETIVPPQYLVELDLADGKKVRLVEDETAFWVEADGKRTAVDGTISPLKLPSFATNRYPGVLRVLHQELLVNVTPAGPVPNYLVYAKPWYRDGAMMAMAFQKTGNLPVIRDWIQKLREPYDRNNAGETEADNLGQALLLISLASDKSHPLVEIILKEAKRFEVTTPDGMYIQGRSDFAERPVYQTKWLKYGLKALNLPDPYTIPIKPDGYSALFWMDYRDRHLPGRDDDNRKEYAYLGWACDHFYGTKKSPISNRDYPLTWEQNASQAKYEGTRVISPDYVKQRISAPHTWHAAEIFLYLLDAEAQPKAK